MVLPPVNTCHFITLQKQYHSFFVMAGNNFNLRIERSCEWGVGSNELKPHWPLTAS